MQHGLGLSLLHTKYRFILLCADDSNISGKQKPMQVNICGMLQGLCSASQMSLGPLLKITFTQYSLPFCKVSWSEMDSVSSGSEGLNAQTVNGSGWVSPESQFQHCFDQNDGFSHKQLIGLYNSVIPTTD